MRSGALSVLLVIAIAAPGCGYATAPTTLSAFALDAGNYTLKISGTGFCTTGTIEGSGPVTVTRGGATWSVRSAQASDSFAMSLTTDGVAAGSVRGEISGTLSGAQGATTSPSGSVTGNNSAPNIAGGPITPASGAPIGSVATFTTPGSSGGCSGATWTLTPR